MRCRDARAHEPDFLSFVQEPCGPALLLEDAPPPCTGRGHRMAFTNSAESTTEDLAGIEEERTARGAKGKYMPWIVVFACGAPPPSRPAVGDTPRLCHPCPDAPELFAACRQGWRGFSQGLPWTTRRAIRPLERARPLDRAPPPD